MYKVAVPVHNWYDNREVDCEAVLAELKKAGAQRIWLCVSRGIEAEDILSADLEKLKEHRIFFEKNGLEVGAWLSSLGHGGLLVYDHARYLERVDSYERIVGLNGTTCEESFCPTGEAFAADYVSWVGRIAQTGVKMIMIDDDYRLASRPCGNGCCCDRHMAEYRVRVGENVSREQLAGLIFKGERSKYRDAWLDMGHDALIGLAKKLRARVDEVDPSVRLGVCAVMTTWDVDGVNAIELTRAMAGNTRPFLRTIGAPYWSAGTRKYLGHIIGLARAQAWWCENEDLELFSEGDAYPRPRYNVPASYLEMYDMALRADGRLDGILKYMIDYTSSVDYEKGYVERMARNKPAYDWIERHMTGTAEGADLVCGYDLFRDAELPDDYSVDEADNAFFYPAGGYLLSDCSIPMAFGTKGVHVTCGENARLLTDDMLEDGAVLDITAAKKLMARGIDVGIESSERCGLAGGAERYIAENEYVNMGGMNRFERLTLKAGAVVLSEIDGRCVCYRYENARGQRFVVYAFDMSASKDGTGVLRSYSRARQLISGVEWAGRKKLPAVCPGNPDAYLICRRTEDGLNAALFNLSADYMLDPVVKLDGTYALESGFGADMSADGESIRICGEVPPYSFVGMSLKKV